MAKIGEGDSRWIVEERADGANVHGWHWVEKDCKEWSTAFFQNAFGAVESEGKEIRFAKTPVRITGEAYLNQRKGKIICGYELEICAEFEFEGEVAGTMVLPYVSEENRGEDCEIKFAQKDESERARRAKRAAESDAGLKEKVREVVRKWEEEMAKGTPAMKGEDGAISNGDKKAEGEETAKTKKKKEEAAAGQQPTRGKTEHEYKSAPLSTKYHTIKLRETFLCRATDVCEALLDPRRVMHFTRTKCTGQKGKGKFDMFDGSVEGETIDFVDGERIVQKWRFNSWEPDHYSTVTMVLKEPEPGNCILDLVQTGVPEADAHGNENVMEVTENGWKNLIFARIRNAFGYGANL